MTGLEAAPAAFPENRLRRNIAFAGHRFGRLWHGRVLTRAWRPWLAIVGVAAGALVLAALLATTLDLSAANWASDLSKPTRKFFRGVTRYGKSDWILIGSGLVFVLLLFGDWRRATRSVAAAWAEIGTIAAFLFFAVAGSGITVNIVKQIVGRGRPNLLPDHGPLAFDPFAFDAAYQGFPSGHSQVMGAVACVAVLVLRRWALIVVIPALIVAASRVIVGAHYPADVLTGLVLGAGFTWLYAVALAEAGVGFVIRPDGRIAAKTVAIRKAGIADMAGGLWKAFFGARPSAV
jgi:membrane-associated phospholipid phosphatase